MINIEGIKTWVENQDDDIDPYGFHLWLLKNTARIDWDEFNEWYSEVHDTPGYEWLSEAYEGWEDDDILPWDEVAEDIEKNKWEMDADGFVEWLDENEDRIDWEDFDRWAERVKDEEGYFWLEKVFYRWREAEYEDLPDYWINEDGMLIIERWAQYME